MIRISVKNLSKVLNFRTSRYSYVLKPNLDCTIGFDRKIIRRFSTEEMQDEVKNEYYTGKPKEEKIFYDLQNPDFFEPRIPFKPVLLLQKKKEFTPKEIADIINFDQEEMLELMKYFSSDTEILTPAQAKMILWNFGYDLLEENYFEASRVPRPPTVAIMGHVDHGKTTLLDYYRKSKIADREAGGITQKIGGFVVETQFGKVSFIDTPGHALFSNMRKTGANCTDMIILVISAIEGVQSQTHEVLNIIKESGLPFIIAINKIDSNKADPEAVEMQLHEFGISIEPKGGNIPIIHISALEGINTNMLLELVLYESERLKINSCLSRRAQLVSMECNFEDAKLASLVVREGTLRKGDVLLAPNTY